MGRLNVIMKDLTPFTPPIDHQHPRVADRLLLCENRQNILTFSKQAHDIKEAFALKVEPDQWETGYAPTAQPGNIQNLAYPPRAGAGVLLQM